MLQILPEKKYMFCCKIIVVEKLDFFPVHYCCILQLHDFPVVSSSNNVYVCLYCTTFLFQSRAIAIDKLEAAVNLTKENAER